MTTRRINWNAIPIHGQVKSLTAWCQQTGVDRPLAYRRIKYGKWPPAQAVGLEPRVIETWAADSRFERKRDVTVKYRGQEHTLKEWHEISKTWERPIPYRTLVDRYNRGYPPEDILDTRRQTAALKRQKKAERFRKSV